MHSPSTESFFFHPNFVRASSPIEIPRRTDEMQAGTRNTGSSERPLSPELIFELELASWDSALNTNYTYGLTLTRSPQEDSGALLYTFPRVSSRHAGHADLALPLASQVLAPIPIAHQVIHRKIEAPPSHNCDGARPHLPSDPSHAIRAVPVHRIAGFTPEPSPALPNENRVKIPTLTPRFAPPTLWHLSDTLNGKQRACLPKTGAHRSRRLAVLGDTGLPRCVARPRRRIMAGRMKTPSLISCGGDWRAGSGLSFTIPSEAATFKPNEHFSLSSSAVSKARIVLRLWS
ncbi:unnamed protein product [Mycena citricolor]|uniref:Uncharacterized protein n=1 Tax=Mycena citricolor TaxID=2018698 RepID=A0AAD2HY30_9AGAR|nr:unnamed protein product [Mycena citricolor]